MAQTVSLAEPEPLPQSGGPAPIIPSPAAGPNSGETRSEAAALGALLAPPLDEQDVLAATGPEEGRPFGLFFALRSVALLYLGVGVAAGLGYEIWCLLVH